MPSARTLDGVWRAVVDGKCKGVAAAEGRGLYLTI
jgi:hypothetical protein